MHFTGLITAAALLAGANAASSETSSANATTSMSTVNLPLVTGMALKASVIHANAGDITYKVECDKGTTGSVKCQIPPLTITEKDHKTYQGEAKKLGIDISLSCAAQSKSAMFCSNSIGGGLAELGNILGGGDKTGSVTATSSGGDLFGLPSTTTYNSNEVGTVVVAITAGVEKLASATKTASDATSTGTVESTGDNAGLPRATGNAGILAGGAMAAFALAL